MQPRNAASINQSKASGPEPEAAALRALKQIARLLSRLAAQEAFRESENRKEPQR